MALDQNAIFTAAKGYVFTGPVGTAVRPTPTQIKAFTEGTGLGATWTDLGHTDREDLPEFGFDGGDTETRGTWRAAALREVITEVAVDYVVVTLSQFDDEGLSLYYGTDNGSETKGEFSVMDSTTATTERAFTIIIEDGPYKIGFWAPRVSVRRDDSIEMAVDEFSKMPIRATFLKRDGVDTNGDAYPLFSWINDDILNPDAV